jgi:8-oxo-dGTP pyrophosphatase MutT (NUDIX family)
MFITADIVKAVEECYGFPLELSRSYEMTAREFDVVRRSQKHGRSHDVTLFIVRENEIVVIKKPMYPKGAYRAPGGGVSPGEPFEEGAIREAYEETGLQIALQSYLARFRVAFTCVGEVIDWTTHVLSAEPVGGTLQPIDTHEIIEARYVTVAELRGSINKALLESGSTGLRYRAELSEIVVNRLVETGRIAE